MPKVYDTLISDDGSEFFRSDEMFAGLQPEKWYKGNELAKLCRYSAVRSRRLYKLTTYDNAKFFCEVTNG